MTTDRITQSRLIITGAIVLLLAAGLAGCASQGSSQVKLTERDHLITDIVTSEDAANLYVTVKSSQPLTFSALRQDSPLGVQFTFPGAALDNLQESYQPPENDTIRLIRATSAAGEDRASMVLIELKRDVPYGTVPEETGLKIAFPKAARAAASDKPAPVTETPLPPPAAPATKEPAKPWQPATEITSITAVQEPGGALIRIEADGTLRDYKAFTISESPPRIVFDIPAVRTSAKTEQRIPVAGGPVGRVRYLGYPDKVRVVVETQKSYLGRYAAEPAETGLVVRVGDAVAAGEPLGRAAEPAPAPVAVKPKTEAAPGAPAWVNRVEFADEAEGKSAVIIGTTQPVRYDIVKAGDRRVVVKLLNTSVPPHHLRPLITTRFDSAVDRATPSQEKSAAVLAIDLREDVAYSAEQIGNVIRINFAGSSIPPKPYEDAQPPAWKTAALSAVVQSQAPAAPGPISLPAAARPGSAVSTKPVAALNPETGEREKVFTGEKIALDFYDTDIKNVFRILQEISGKNFAVDKNVTGKVTLALQKPVPWDQVMDLVLKMNQLGMVMEGDIIRVATLASLQQEEKLRQAQLKAEQESRKQEEEGEPLITEYIPVNYSTAKTEVLPHLNNILTPNRGKVSVDERNNQIIFTDIADKVRQAKAIVAKIDRVTPQVIIESRIVEANSSFNREIGFDWGTISIEAFKIGGALKTGPTTLQANNIPTSFRPDNTIGFNFSTLFGTNISIVDAKLSASELEGKATVISAPKIITLNNKEATIKQGLEVPYLERDSSGNATVRFKDVDLLLRVTPKVSQDQRIVMNIFVTKNDVVDPTAPEPALSTNEAKTEILVEDGDTIVIGGILKDTKKLTEQGIPGLRNLPALGWLFRSERTENSKNELLIFITPRIIQLEQRKLI
ncbi:MAG: type IV pilus secretin PilQ [Desulfobacterales bacterium]|jgi:type IV pilus assembly protein PilQ|nr:type IV pilus secretin PilQ [Desulfobacterales bacterium]